MVKPVLKDHCHERPPVFNILKSHIYCIPGRLYISMKLNLWWLKSTSLARPHFKGQWGGLSVRFYYTIGKWLLYSNLRLSQHEVPQYNIRYKLQPQGHRQSPLWLCMLWHNIHNGHWSYSVSCTCSTGVLVGVKRFIKQSIRFNATTAQIDSIWFFSIWFFKASGAIQFAIRIYSSIRMS